MTTEGWDAIHRDLDRLELWAEVHEVQQIKVQGLAPQSRQSCCHQYKPANIRMENSRAERDLGILVDGRLDTNKQCVLTAQKANHILGCIKVSMASKVREVTFCSVLVRPHLEYCIQMWSLQYRRDTDLLESIQRRTTNMIQGMEYLSYENRQRRAGAVQSGGGKASRET